MTAATNVLIAPALAERREEITVIAGMTVAEIVSAALPGLPLQALNRVRVALVTRAGSMILSPNCWRLIRPKPGVQVLIRIVPGNNGLRSVLSILVSVAALALGQFWLGPLVATTLNISTNLAAALVGVGVQMVGSFLINMLLPPQQASTREEKPVYAISGWRNEARPDAAVPLILGKHRIAPPFAAMTWTEIVGDEMFLRALFCVGYGPLKLSDLRIGETSLSAFEDVEVELREGWPGDAPITLYPQQVIEAPEGVELADETPITRVSASDARYLCLIFGWPGGLIRYTDKGNERSMTVRVKIRQRRVGAGGDWQDVRTLSFSAMSKEAVYRSFRWTPPSRGRWEIEITRLPDTTSSTQKFNRTVLVAVQSIRPEYPLNFDKPLALVAVRVKATHQLNGTLDRFNLIASSILLDWDAPSKQWVQRESRNPAACYRHMLQGPAARYPAAADAIDLDGLAEWSRFCTAKGLNYDRIHDFEASILEGLSAVAQAGRASPSHDGRRWGVIIDRPRDIVVDHLNGRNSRGLRWQRPYFEPPHAYRVPFIDASNDYQSGEMIVPWPGHQGEITVTQERPLPGKTDPREIWIETRRAQYAAIHRPDVITVIQNGAARVATRGDMVMGSWDVLDRTMTAARVVAVRGNLIELDAPVSMTAGQTYALRWRVFGANDTIGESIVRQVTTLVGETDAVAVIGDDVPKAGDLVHFGRTANDSLPLIVASIEPGNDMASVLTLQAHVPLIDELTDAEVPPPWDGRVGFISGQVTTPPAAPIILSIVSGMSGTGYVDGLEITLRAGAGVAVAQFEVEHRLAGTATWTTITLQVGEAGTTIAGYLSGQSVNLRARAVSWAGVSGPYTSIRTVTVASGDLPAPTALPEDSISITGRDGHAEIVFATGADTATVAVRIYRDDMMVATVPVSPLGTFGRIDGDSTVAMIVSDFTDAGAWTLGDGWSIDAGAAVAEAGEESTIDQPAILVAGAVYRYRFIIANREDGSVAIRLSGGGEDVDGQAISADGQARGSITADEGNNRIGLAKSATFASHVTGLVVFRETTACLEQGNHNYQLEPINDDDVPGPRSALRTVVVT